MRFGATCRTFLCALLVCLLAKNGTKNWTRFWNQNRYPKMGPNVSKCVICPSRGEPNQVPKTGTSLGPKIDTPSAFLLILVRGFSNHWTYVPRGLQCKGDCPYACRALTKRLAMITSSRQQSRAHVFEKMARFQHWVPSAFHGHPSGDATRAHARRHVPSHRK